MTYMQNLAAGIIETKRHNEASEAQQRNELAETVRSHKVNEALAEADLNEKIRHQTTMDAETMRANRVSEAEINRHNSVTEAIQRENNQIQRYAAELNYQAVQDRILNDQIIEKMKIDSTQLIENAKRRIDQANSKSQAKQAEAALKSATARMNSSFAALDQAQAALSNAQINKDLEGLQATNMVTKSVGDIADSARSISSVMMGGGLLPKGSQTAKKVAQTAGKAVAPGSKSSNGSYKQPNYDTSTFAPKSSNVPALKKKDVVVATLDDGRQVLIPNDSLGKQYGGNYYGS